MFEHPAHLTSEEQTIVEQELALLHRVQAHLARAATAEAASTDLDADLIDLRDQLAETRAEDHAMLVEHMTRLAALRATQSRAQVAALPDAANPYFAHLRLRDLHEGRERVRDVLVGRRAFIDTRNDLQIVDWRNSPISRIYYCYNEGDEYEERFAGELQTGHVELRRTVTVERGELTRVRAGDLVLLRGPDGEWHRQSAERSRLAGGVGSALRPPAGRLGRGVNQRLPEITALIDPEQFRAITDARSGVVIIRGGAGTGKTTIALHRAAWLHFQDPRRFAPKRMLIVTPGDALRRYIAEVLPALDVEGVRIRTFRGWAHETLKRLVPSLAKRALTDETPSGARRLKRHPALLRLIERAVREEGRAFEAQLAEVGGAPLLDAWVRRRNLPTMVRLDAVERWVRDEGKATFGDTLWAVRKTLDRIRDELSDPADLWAELLTDRGRVAAAFQAWGEKPYEWELDQLVDTVSRQSDEPLDLSDFDESRRTGIDGLAVDEGDIRSKLDVDDLAAVLRIAQLRYGRLAGPSGRTVPSFEHLVVDEAQDHSPLVLKVLCESVRPAAPVTLAGDTAQRITLDNGFDDWDALVRTLDLKAHVLPALSVTYRSTRQVMALARHVLGPLVADEPARDARDGAPVELVRHDEAGEAVAFLADALKSLRERERRASVALIARAPEIADLYYGGLKRAEVPELRRVVNQEFDFSPGIDVTDVYQIKGLEYDYVIMLEATLEQYPETLESRHLFHVAATRAAHQLWLVASGRPSPLLPDWLLRGEAPPDELAADAAAGE